MMIVENNIIYAWDNNCDVYFLSSFDKNDHHFYIVCYPCTFWCLHIYRYLNETKILLNSNHEQYISTGTCRMAGFPNSIEILVLISLKISISVTYAMYIRVLYACIIEFKLPRTFPKAFICLITHSCVNYTKLHNLFIG